MKRLLFGLAVSLAMTACRPVKECKGLITGPEYHRDTVTLKCK